MKKLLVALLVPIVLAGCGDPVDLQPTPTPAQPTATMTATPTAEQAALQSTKPPTTTPTPTSAATTATRPAPTATATQPPPESSPTSSPLPPDLPVATVDANGGTPASPAESQDEDQPTATATPVTEPTSAPAASPTSTTTPLPEPTATPTPTPPPTATATQPAPPVVLPSPTPVPEGISEDEYVRWAYDIYIRRIDSLVAYSEHLMQPAFDRSHPDNAAWYATFVALLGDWESMAAEAAAQPAPSSLAAQHQEIVAGYGKIGEAARLNKLAYDTSDSDVLNQATELLDSGDSQIAAAMNQLPPPSS